MSEQSGLARVARNIREMRHELVEAIATARHAELSDVKFLQGKVEALRLVLDDVEHIRSTIEEDDDGSAAE